MLFLPSQGEAVPTGSDSFAVRFHLHPSIKANRLTDSHGAMLMLPNKEVWTFNAYDDHIDLEESVYLAGPDGPRRTMQIVIYGRARNDDAGAMDLRPRAARRQRAAPRSRRRSRNCRSDDCVLPARPGLTRQSIVPYRKRLMGAG